MIRNKSPHSIYLTTSKAFLTLEEIYSVLEQKKIEFSMAPIATMKYAEFLYKIGSIKTMPQSWKDYFFQDPEIANLPGS